MADLVGSSLAIHDKPRPVPIDLEVDVAARLDAERAPDVQRNGDLPFLRDPHASKDTKYYQRWPTWST